MNKNYLAEFVGTFVLAFAVYVSVALGSVLAVPVLAALVVGAFVYTIGPISGCHINPAVTIGLLSIRKISVRDAAGYIIAQFLGAIVAMALGSAIVEAGPAAAMMSLSVPMMLAEALGAAILTFGIASVVFGKTPSSASGLVIGGSLLVGVALASSAGSAGILNPAVALTASSLDLTYILGPIAGSLLGFWTYRALS